MSTERQGSRPALFVVLLLILAYGIYFSAYSIENHRALLTHASDLGQVDQAIWNSLNGHLLDATRPNQTNAPRFTDHVEPLFIPLSLVLLIYDGVESLLVAQSFAIAIGALAVFWIARKKFSSLPGSFLGTPGRRDWLAVGFAALYLLFPALEAANLAELHAVTFAPALVLFTYHYGTEKKWGWFALFAFLALMVKEEISLLVFMLSAYFSVADFRLLLSALQGDRGSLRLGNQKLFNRIPLFFAVLSLAWFALTMLVIIPSFSPAGKWVYTCRYLVSEECGVVERGLLLNARGTYLLTLFASVGFVALFDPVALALGAPLIIANVVSNYPAQYSGTYHYSAPVAPYLVLAAIGGTVRLQEWLQRARDANVRILASPVARVSVLALPFLLALGYHLLAGYTPIGGAFAWTPVDSHAELLTRFTNQIPREAIVATTSALNPHLSHRRFLYRYSPAFEPAKYPQFNVEYVLIDVHESVSTNPNDFRTQYDELLKQGYGIADAGDGYILLKRGSDKTILPSEFYSYFRRRDEPQVRVRVDFGDALRLTGYDVLNDSNGRVSVRLYWQRLRALDTNYTLVPVYLDENGDPRADIDMPPPTVLYWYPTSAWQAGETIGVETLPVDVGPHARIGVAVVDGDDFNDVSARLPARVDTPATLRAFDSNTLVEIGGVIKTTRRYRGE